ncbi:mechanosensitive ion channel domain-containing protein [Alienimonas californiensis]|uniref:Small-conductance mechanosensitive channel n=1 Tax=Alienimonas californiensis TaxID=2527989 RepID=A0A517P5K4_9PLAN|nr:mechanosensitive ion channel domain-containing protein [Alienimonas californiensis]QDT14654.1 Small-conductance mechanosensitive channel [Alienimonas californiensis]
MPRRRSPLPASASAVVRTALALGLTATVAAAAPRLLQEPPAAEAPADEVPADGEAAEGPELEIAQVIPVEQTVDDDKIAARITALLTTYDYIKNPGVTSEGGVVKLTGTTDVSAHKDLARDWAKRVEGVFGVQNDIVVDRSFNAQRAWTQVRSSVQTLWEDFLEQSPLLLVALVALLLTGVLAKIARFIFSRTPGYGKLRSSLQDLLEQFLVVGVWVLGVLIAATVAFPGVTPGSLIATLGLGGVAIGFAFKDVFENFLAGIFILWKFPFDRGDFIECGEVKGKIQQITIRNTLVRQPDGVLVVIPNADLFKNPVEVLTNWKSRRVTITCGVAYGEDVDASREVIHQAVAGCETVESRKPIEIFADEFADSSVNFKISWWADPTPLGERQSRDQVVSAVKRALDDAGIEIPFPQRTLWFKETLNLSNRDDDGGSNGDGTSNGG